MDLGLRDRMIFIAGASQGIGAGIVESCLAEGARVAVAARGAEKLEAAATEWRARYGADAVYAIAADLRHADAIEEAITRAEAALGPLFGAVANVGLTDCSQGFEITDDDWEAGLSQNLSSAFKLARASLHRMSARHEGSLLFITSIGGMRALGAPLPYGAAKAGLNQMARELGASAGATGVRVNALAPGNILFPGGNWERRLQGPQGQGWLKSIQREVPLGRFGEPKEIGDVAAFLLSPRASYVNATTIVVDGGQTRVF